MEQVSILVDNMIFCFAIEIIILLYIVLDLLKMKKILNDKYINFLRMILAISFGFLFAYAFFSGKESKIILLINNNREFYFIYLISVMAWLILEIISYLKKK